MSENKKFISYNKQINKLILHMIKHVMKSVAENGLPGDHHFYIKFLTTHPGVKIQDSDGSFDGEILKQHSHDMTIVLQNAFENLVVDDNKFSVVLTFNALKKKLTIPFDSILTFHDPFANFAVHLDTNKYEDGEGEYLEFEDYDDYVLDEDDEDDELSKFLEYDYNSYKTDELQKIVFLEDIKKNLKKA